MRLLTLKEWRGVPAHRFVEAGDLTPGETRRGFALGFLARPTVQNMRAAAQARGIPGWHNMKAETLQERLTNGESNTE